MNHPFVDYPTPKKEIFDIKTWLALCELPSILERQSIIELIISGAPSILLFKHYWWLTGKPVPERHNLQTNDEYVKKHWRHLKRAAGAYVMPEIHLDNPSPIG